MVPCIVWPEILGASDRSALRASWKSYLTSDTIRVSDPTMHNTIMLKSLNNR